MCIQLPYSWRADAKSAIQHAVIVNGHFPQTKLSACRKPVLCGLSSQEFSTREGADGSTRTYPANNEVRSTIIANVQTAIGTKSNFLNSKEFCRASRPTIPIWHSYIGEYPITANYRSNY